MDPRRRALVMVVLFVGLMAFHGWLLYRVARAGNTVLAVLLAIAVALFAWRIAHYVGRYRRGEIAASPAQERRRIAVIAPVLAALLPLHAWMISLTLSAGDAVLTAVLVASVAVFAGRLVFYWRRYAGLRAAAESFDELEVGLRAERDPRDSALPEHRQQALVARDDGRP